MVSSVDHSRTISRQLNGFDVFSPNDFRRDKGGTTIRSMCINVGTVEGIAEATRWRKVSFVSIISLCYRGPTLEYDSGVFFLCLFFQWSVHRTCGFDGASRWTGGSRYERAPQATYPLPQQNKMSSRFAREILSSRFAREIHSVSSLLSALVT